jgi:hypothetical protein
MTARQVIYRCGITQITYTRWSTGLSCFCRDQRGLSALPPLYSPEAVIDGLHPNFADITCISIDGDELKQFAGEVRLRVPPTGEKP